MNREFSGVYIMGNDRPTLYIGMSNNIIRRVLEHKKGKIKGFTQKYNCKKLLYYEFCETMNSCIFREKCLKRLKRQEKLDLIKSKNPMLADISSELFSFVENPKDIDCFGLEN